MRHPLLWTLGIALFLAAAVLAVHWRGGSPDLNPFPAPDNPDPAGILAFQMLLTRRGIPAEVRSGLPETPSQTLLFFAETPRRYSAEEVEEVLDWVRGGGHLVLICGGASLSPPPLLGDLGLQFEPAILAGTEKAKVIPHVGVTLRPAAFTLLGGDLRVRGLTGDDRPCWVSGTLGDGSWEALADSYPFENAGLGEGGNAHFALALAGPNPRLDSSLFVPDRPPTLGNEPLFWGALLQFLLLGGTLLFQLRRLGPPLEPRPAAGSLRLRAGIARILAERRAPGEILELEAASGQWTETERRRMKELARDGDLAGGYRLVRQKEKRP